MGLVTRLYCCTFDVWWAKSPKHKVPWVYIMHRLGGNALEPPLRPGVLHWMVSYWIMGCFRSLWHLLECCSCYVKSTELSQLWPLLAHQQGWIPSGYMLMSRYFPKGELSHLSHLCKDLCTLPRRICLCPYLVQHPAIAWGVSCACSLHLGGYFAQVSLSLIVWATSIPVSHIFSYIYGYILLPSLVNFSLDLG